MKPLLYLFPFFLLVLSCSPNLKKTEVKTEFGTEIYYLNADSLKQGSFLELSLDGDTVSFAQYQDNLLHGTRKIYSEDGYVMIEEHYEKDQFHGPVTTYYANGNVETKGNYTNNILDETFYTYYDTGELKEKVTIQDNEENGPFEEYYKSGAIHWKGSFINGPNEIGPLLEYDEKGTLIKKMECGLYLGEYICQTVWDIENGDVPLKIEYEQ